MIADCLQRQSQIAKEIEQVRAQLESAAIRLRQGISWGSDEADQANDLVERAKALALYQHLTQKYRQLEHARARLDLGLDGACEVCGQLIHTARLKVLVGTTRCLECQQRVEQRAHRYQRCALRPQVV